MGADADRQDQGAEMSLREEIAHLIEEVIVDPLQYQSITQSDQIINKVLDAAIMAIIRREEHQTPVEAIQALKEGKE
jgi:hypothetical protein